MVALPAAAVLAFLAWKARKAYMALPELPVADAAAPPDVTVIIPARNEEANIAGAVRSFPNTRVIVVDDQSKDRTAQAAAEAGAEVITAPKIQRGHLGKPNACMAGGKMATTRYLLFADADTRFEPEFLAVATRYADDNDLILLTAFLRPRCSGILESTVVPYAYALYFCGVNAANAQNFLNPEVVANGQCMLFQRQPYEFIGGHNSAITSVLDDVALTARVKRHRMKLQVMRAEHLGSARAAGGWREVWQSCRRNSMRFSLMSFWSRLRAILVLFLMMSVIPLCAWLAFDQQYWAVFLFALLMPYLFAPWYGGLLRAVLIFPAMLLMPLLALESIVASTLGRKAGWKGRKV